MTTVLANEKFESSTIESTTALDSSTLINFEGDINDVIKTINDFYLKDVNPLSRAAAGTKWDVVGKAQRKAVTAKYGSVNNKTSYKMKTTQYVSRTGKYGNAYKTVSPNAWCYGR